MRLWSLDPALLDRQGLVACWREALLAQAVLLGRTKGYTAHPQLRRFRDHPEPVVAVAAYLHGVRDEATRRGYRFDKERITHPADEHLCATRRIEVTTGQLALERRILLRKLADRSPDDWARATATTSLAPHPLFVIVPGDVAGWERAS